KVNFYIIPHLPDITQEDKFFLVFLIQIKKLPITSEYTKYRVIDDGLDILHIEYQKNEEKLIFLCNVGQVRDDVKIDFPSGEYNNLFNNKKIRVDDGFIRLSKYPIILHK
ncbi:MAG: hypothetical protein KMY54_01645, partial [Erysipelothrix sp.]|nr:hypothetical protein [Erysipelothrix sp.]